MPLPSDTVSGESLDVVLSSPEAPIVSPAPADQPGRIASPQPSDASAHITDDDEEQRSTGIATARGGDREALILKAGGVNESSQILGAQSRPSSSEFTPGATVNSSSSDCVKVLFDGSSANAGGSTSANGGPETSVSVQPPVFRNSTPVHRSNAWFLPQSQVIGGNRHRFNSGGYRNQPPHPERGVHGWNGPQVLDTNPHMWMPMPRLQGHGQPFMAPCAFMPRQAGPPFASPIGYTDGTSPYYGTPSTVLQTYYASQPPLLETYYARPPPPPPPPLPLPQPHQMPHVVDKQLVLKKQIEYYFSVDNLCKDVFLRRNMDAQGWVSISLIATFRRVQIVTSNTNYILSALRSSTVIEIQRENIRRRNDWERWVLPSATGRDGQASGSTYAKKVESATPAAPHDRPHDYL